MIYWAQENRPDAFTDITVGNNIFDGQGFGDVAQNTAYCGQGYVATEVRYPPPQTQTQTQINVCINFQLVYLLRILYFSFIATLLNILQPIKGWDPVTGVGHMNFPGFVAAAKEYYCTGIR